MTKHGCLIRIFVFFFSLGFGFKIAVGCPFQLYQHIKVESNQKSSHVRNYQYVDQFLKTLNTLAYHTDIRHTVTIKSKDHFIVTTPAGKYDFYYTEDLTEHVWYSPKLTFNSKNQQYKGETTFTTQTREYDILRMLRADPTINPYLLHPSQYPNNFKPIPLFVQHQALYHIFTRFNQPYRRSALIIPETVRHLTIAYYIQELARFHSRMPKGIGSKNLPRVLYVYKNAAEKSTILAFLSKVGGFHKSVELNYPGDLIRVIRLDATGQRESNHVDTEIFQKNNTFRLAKISDEYKVFLVSRENFLNQSNQFMTFIGKYSSPWIVIIDEAQLIEPEHFVSIHSHFIASKHPVLFVGNDISGSDSEATKYFVNRFLAHNFFAPLLKGSELSMLNRVNNHQGESLANVGATLVYRSIEKGYHVPLTVIPKSRNTGWFDLQFTQTLNSIDQQIRHHTYQSLLLVESQKEADSIHAMIQKNLSKSLFERQIIMTSNNIIQNGYHIYAAHLLSHHTNPWQIIQQASRLGPHKSELLLYDYAGSLEGYEKQFPQVILPK